MKSSYYLDVLRGRSQELPDVRSKVVRVFVSSTFTDTLAERDSLIENIFPKLKDYCRQQYGLEFQYVDMRWGIQTESANNHGEVATCLKEIELCKKYSVATNFVVLLSHRYGSRPIPAQIRASLFDLLKDTVHSEHDISNDNDLLTQWYKLDTNCIPPAYILQNISSILPNFLSRNTDEVKQADKEWKKISDRLRNCLRQAAELCLQRKQITENDYDEFFISITEKEIVNGILSATDANERTLCFLREIVDIEDHLSDEKVSKYIDMSSQTDINHEAKKLLDRLKTTRIPGVLQASNIYKYNVRWSSHGITRQDHVEYLEKFNNDFYRAMKEQIDKCVQARFTIGSDSLQHEVLEHAIQCKTYVTKFHGRTDVLSKLGEYVKKKSEHRPCVVYGHSGCGKTSVLAKTATEVFRWWPDRSVSVILRFLGTTPASSTIYKTLLSISSQICELYNISMTAYPTVNQLRDQLESNLLSQIPDNEYLLILLDSIDQLQTDAYDCKWLPVRFPTNVKCIVSTLPDHGGILSNLKVILLENEKLFINVPPFEPSTVEIVYNDWLAMKHRSLSDDQRVFINHLMQQRKEILPLFMKLFFDIISVWHSYDPIDERLNALKDVDDCIRYLFQRLQIVHNTVLFSRALCYMTACRSGISQNELEDVLSLDDDVLKSVFQHYIPPVRRVPGILWTRIRNDLDEYITEKEVDDAPVIYWYHRRFIEVARELYISNLNETDRRTVFQNVVDLFKETWKGKNKPFKIDDPKLVHKYKLGQSDGEIQANRFTTSQPIEFIDVDGRIQYNKRKLNELPPFLSKLAPDIALPIAAEEMFFNYAFMHAKFSCSSYIDTQLDLQLFENQSTYKMGDKIVQIKKEIAVLTITYLLFGLSLNEYPDNYAFELTNRLVTLYGIKPSITELIKQCDEQSPRHCALIVPYSQIQPPGNGLLYSMNKHTMPVVDLDFLTKQMSVISLSNKIIVINLRSGITVAEIKLPKLNEPYLNSTTLANMVSMPTTKDEAREYHDSTDSPNSDDDNVELFKHYMFLVNSAHHVYLVSNHGDIRFQQTSTKGYSTVEVLYSKSGLCILVEENSSSMECWDLGKNKLFAKLDFPLKGPIRKVLFSKRPFFILTIVFYDGTILLYTLKGSTFVHRGTIDAGKHLDLIIADRDKLICTFDSTIPIDFALIDLRPLSKTEVALSDNDIVKTLVAFNPSITPKPFHRIVLPEDKETSDNSTVKIFFMILTKESVCIVHICRRTEISYVNISGQYDIVATHAAKPYLLFTARRGTVNLYRWRCLKRDNDAHDKCQISHEYQLLMSVDISSSPVLTLKPTNSTSGFFFCSMQNGTINAYNSLAARAAFKKIPPFPRTTEVIDTIQLSGTNAITLDVSKQELTTWLYQHSTAIESTRLFPSSTKIDNYAVLSQTAVLIITSTYWTEIYPLQSLNKQPLFRLHLGHPTRVFLIDENAFLLLTNDGSIRFITQQITKNSSKFNQSPDKKLNIQCTKLLSSIITLNAKQTFIVLADDERSLAMCTSNEIVYMNIDLTQHSSSRVVRLTSDKTQEILLFYLENKSLISCRIQLANKNSYQLTSLHTADKFCSKKHCLATILHDKNQLHLHDLQSGITHEPIQLENECEHLCISESGDYLFVLVQPRVLYMYRTKDRRQLARLFVYDHVTTMIADNDFIVMAMNDRRLLTLLIADPDDPTLQSKIQALPSRNLKRDSHSAAKQVAEHMDTYMDMSSDDYDSDIESDDETDNKELNIYSKRKVNQSMTVYRYVHRLNGRLSLSKMKTDESYRTYFLQNYTDSSKVPDASQVVIDDSDIDDNDDVIGETSSPVVSPSVKQEYNLDDIRGKTLEHDRQQIKGIQLANAGVNNPKIMNDYSVTSNTCMLL